MPAELVPVMECVAPASPSLLHQRLWWRDRTSSCSKRSGQPVPVKKHAPVHAVTAAPCPEVECIAPAPASEHIAPAPAVSEALAPVVECIAPATEVALNASGVIGNFVAQFKCVTLDDLTERHVILLFVRFPFLLFSAMPVLGSVEKYGFRVVLLNGTEVPVLGTLVDFKTSMRMPSSMSRLSLRTSCRTPWHRLTPSGRSLLPPLKHPTRFQIRQIITILASFNRLS